MMTNKELLHKLNEAKLTIHELGIRVNSLEKNSHPPIFKKDAYEVIDARLQIMEAFYNNIKLITTNEKELE